MRRFTTRAVPALLAFLVGVGASHLWRGVAPLRADSGSYAGHGVETVHVKFIKRAGGIPSQYVVLLDDSVPADAVGAVAAELTRAHGGRVQFVYRAALKGFSVTEATEGAAEAISRDPRVSYVESSMMGRLN